MINSYFYSLNDLILPCWIPNSEINVIGIANIQLANYEIEGIVDWKT